MPEALETDNLIIGWARAKGLLNPDLDWVGFRRIIHDEYHDKAETFRGAGRDAGKMWLFIREMKKGDLVVVPAGPEFHVGEVAGDEAFYDPEKMEEDSAYRRAVNWLNSAQRIAEAGDDGVHRGRKRSDEKPDAIHEFAPVLACQCRGYNTQDRPFQDGRVAAKGQESS